MAGVLVAGTNGIVVAAGPSDVVILRGLSFDGVGLGLDGVRYQSGAMLVIVERHELEFLLLESRNEPLGYIVRLPELAGLTVPTVTPVLLPEADGPPLPTITAATFDVVVEAETSKAAEVLGSAVINATTLGWSFLCSLIQHTGSYANWFGLLFQGRPLFT